MEAATWLLFVLGLLGAADIALYHSVAHGIRHHHDSRLELYIHSLRGPTYAALFVLIPNFGLYGIFFWVLLLLFAFDVAISIADFAIEKGSRQVLGGLPSGEYVLHIIIAMLFGALVTSVIYGAGGRAFMETGIVYQPAAVPFVLRVVMLVMAVVVMISGVKDFTAARRLRGGSSRPGRIQPESSGSGIST